MLEVSDSWRRWELVYAITSCQGARRSWFSVRMTYLIAISSNLQPFENVLPNSKLEHQHLVGQRSQISHSKKQEVAEGGEVTRLPHKIAQFCEFYCFVDANRLCETLSMTNSWSFWPSCKFGIEHNTLSCLSLIRMRFLSPSLCHTWSINGSYKAPFLEALQPPQHPCFTMLMVWGQCTSVSNFCIFILIWRRLWDPKQRRGMGMLKLFWVHLNWITISSRRWRFQCKELYCHQIFCLK